MAQVSNAGNSSITSAKAYIQEVKLLPSQNERRGRHKKPGFFVVKLAMHCGRGENGKLRYLYPECGITEDLEGLVKHFQERLAAEPDERIPVYVEVLNLRGSPWFADDGSPKSGVNFRGTLCGIYPVEEDEDAAE